MQVGIIGGTGGMGTFFRRVFEGAGHSVLVSGRNTPLSNRDLAKRCDLVLVSVPIRSTAAVIAEVAPLLTEDQILADLTSLKAGPVKAMLHSRAEVIGMHPMFGPTAGSLADQTIILTPGRCSEGTLAVLTGIFERQGAHVTLTTPEKHDAMMAVVQGLTHFATLALAETLRRMACDPGDLLAYTSPVYRIELGLIGRILGQDADLYAGILQQNPAVPEVLSAFTDAVADLAGIVRTGDPERFREFFDTNASAFSGYTGRAAEETDAMIRALVRR
jgi:prephenate dehydrogenase